MNSQMQYVQRMNRRAFTSASAAGAGLIALDPLAAACEDLEAETQKLRYPEKIDLSSLDLSPAKWIWYPAVRTLANTVVLFRREFSLPAKPKSVRGWMLGESRYRLEVNGQRMQWGPPPNDPRWPECDPVDLTHVVHEGPNVLGVAVLYYGDGEGTWPMGLPGLIVCLEICHADGETEWLVTDERWLCQVCRAWEPGGHRRSYLRAFQEVFDARKYPSGWSSPNRLEANDWLEATVIECPSDKPVICGKRREPIAGIGTPKETHATMSLRRRSLAMMNETWVPVTRLAEQHVLSWSRPIEEVFAMRTRDAWQAEPAALVASKPDGQWEFALDAERSVALTFEFEEQGVGFPGLTIDAPEGTTFELLVHDAHAVGSEKVLLDTGHHSWTRFVCRQELQELETFDFETARWLQLHFHPGKGNVCIKRVGMRRRIYPWPAEPRVETSEKKLQRLFDAATNTLRNCAQETLVDTMGRERQQYSGDISHQHHALLALTGETRQVARFLVTFSQGMTKDGYFLDCWPAVDRLKRIAQRQLNLTQWGPLLDHGVQFLLDGWNYFLYTGDRTPLEEVLPRYLRFAEYLESIRAS
ncbi:MAG: alpha-L-rhamnosidase N-terminal domain-containing protein, partial [Planctomycetota bacterium]